MLKNLNKLFSLDDEALFHEAQAIGKAFKYVRCSPIPIIGTCKTQPVCRHCRWENSRRINPTFSRKRTRADILQRTKVLNKAGIDRAFMPSGWMGYDVPDFFYEDIITVKENSAMEVYGLFGAVSRKSLIGLKEAGMDGYFCGLESPNEKVYHQFRPGGDSLADRKKAIYDAVDIGIKIWSGFLIGLGETQADVMDGLKFFSDIGVDSVSILPFIPVPYTELQGENPPNPLHWARTVAICRIYLDTADIFVTNDSCYVDYGRITGANGNYVRIPDKL